MNLNQIMPYCKSILCCVVQKEDEGATKNNMHESIKKLKPKHPLVLDEEQEL